MKKKWTALLLVLALVLGIGAGVASADDSEPPEAAEASSEAVDTVEAAEPADTAAEADAAETGAADPTGAIAFTSLRAQMMENYYPLLALGESIQILDEWDYKKTEDELRSEMNKTADQQWKAMTAGSSGGSAAEPAVSDGLDTAIAATGAALLSTPTDEALLARQTALTASKAALQTSQAALQMASATGAAMSSMSAQQLQLQYDAYKEAYDDIRSGKTQKDNEGVKKQLVNAQDQAVIVAESLFITLKDLEMRDAALTRTVESLKRTEKELKLREELGQVSAFTVMQVSDGLSQAESGQRTLRMNMNTILRQIKVMTGRALDAAVTVGALPRVTAQQLSAMSLETDLAKAVSVSYELYDAKTTFDNAKKDYDDALEKYGAYSKKNEWMQAKHTWQAAQYTYSNAQQSYELKFRTLYEQVRDAAQVLEAKRDTLAKQEQSYAISALKYQQGAISANALADAADELAAVKDEVATAERDLFSQYRSYYWATEYGILNS